MKETTILNSRPCKKCYGEGTRFWKGCTDNGGQVYPDENKVCIYCNGAGHFPPLDIPSICEEIKGRKGLRSARPKSARAYYVWRLARFNGGADVTMPVCAMFDNGGDPFIKELDLVADAVAKNVFGTDLAAAYRWGNALGHNLTVPDNMPAAAYSCGPVADADKPPEEQKELV